MRRLKRSRPDAGARGAARLSTFGGVTSQDTADSTKTEPLALIVEIGGAIRRATDAELRRAARLGLVGGRA